MIWGLKMIKNLLFGLALCGIAATAHATPVSEFARRNGPYISLKAGVSNTEMKSGHLNEKDTSASAGAAFGIRARNIRLEAEYHSHTRVKWNDMDLTQDSVGLQFYFDLPLQSRIQPFINLGGGIMFMGASIDNGQRYSSEDDDQNPLFWNVGAGLSFTATNHVNVDIGYRYTDVEKEEFYHTFKLKSRINEGYIALRYTF